MIRQDYILTWIKRYIRWLVEIADFVKATDYEAAIRRIDLVLRTLLEVGPDSVTDLSDGEILGRLTLGEPGPSVEDKCMVLAAVLKQLGVVSAAQQRFDLSRDCLVKALHLVLGLKLREGGSELAEYTPSVGELLEALQPYDLPPRTYGALMICFEQIGRFDKAEDALFSLLEAAPGNSDAVEMGRAFYERLLGLGDDALIEGRLPRSEVEAGLAEVRKIP